MALFELTYPSTLDAANRALDDLIEVMTEHGVSSERIRALSLAVSEAFTNAVVHGNGQDPKKTVRMKLHVNADRIRADIEDEGQDGVRHIERRRPSTDQDEGGRGIDLITVYSDTCSFTELPAGGLRVSIELIREKCATVK